MTRYLLSRTIQAVFVLWAAFTVTFVVLYLLPSDPVEIMVSGNDANTYSPEQLDSLRAEYGLDQPLPLQYLNALRRALLGDFGQSVQTGGEVRDMLLDALPSTLRLGGIALVLAVAAGAAIGLGGTFVRWRPLRNALLSLPAAAISLPSFWVGLLLLQVVSFQWGLVPATGEEGWAALILPAITLCLPSAALLGQVFAKSMRTALAEPFVDTARAKGASRARVHLRHAARNAALPALTLAGIVVGNLIAGSVVVETVFSRSGVGRLTATAVSAQDVPVVQAVVVLGAVVFVVVNLIVDLLYPLLDPRVTAHAGTGRR
ncbi:ABC transporter permease [Solwaraspora sp. WMMD1047]|uniref:ABC transporter permease n=1 Tax=Solwaraspora sp. WMMD1047 TaxID=3016102 RepID=UPI0024179E84|nr:ABC transporter permease [Solwaraspora sp. WMMD1047]MDG4834248.1 ABC transporter permease [Solwaraspora sp. WMMD1047]